MHRRTLVIFSWAAAGIFGLPSPILAQIANQTCVYDFTRVTPEVSNTISQLLRYCLRKG